MLNLERESEFDRGCLYQLGYPRAWCGGQESNLHWTASVSFSVSFSLRSWRTPHPPAGGVSVYANRYPNTLSPTWRSTASALLASSRANLTACCSRSTRSSSTDTRLAGSAPENFTVVQ